MQSVKYGLLGLLAESPRHGYDLKGAFEELLGDAWELNIGQVYSTLSRLERDGLVENRLEPQDLVPDRKVYSVTPEGLAVLEEWLSEPSDGPIRLKEELFVKVLLSTRLNGKDPRRLIGAQRQQFLSTLAQLQELADAETATNTKLIIEGAILHLEADLRWLDLCDEELSKRRKR